MEGNIPYSQVLVDITAYATWERCPVAGKGRATRAPQKWKTQSNACTHLLISKRPSKEGDSQKSVYPT